MEGVDLTKSSNMDIDEQNQDDQSNNGCFSCLPGRRKLSNLFKTAPNPKEPSQGAGDPPESSDEINYKSAGGLNPVYEHEEKDTTHPITPVVSCIAIIEDIPGPTIDDSDSKTIDPPDSAEDKNTEDQENYDETNTPDQEIVSDDHDTTKDTSTDDQNNLKSDRPKQEKRERDKRDSLLSQNNQDVVSSEEFGDHDTTTDTSTDEPNNLKSDRPKQDKRERDKRDSLLSQNNQYVASSEEFRDHDTTTDTSTDEPNNLKSDRLKQDKRERDKRDSLLSQSNQDVVSSEEFRDHDTTTDTSTDEPNNLKSDRPEQDKRERDKRDSLLSKNKSDQKGHRPERISTDSYESGYESMGNNSRRSTASSLGLNTDRAIITWSIVEENENEDEVTIIDPPPQNAVSVSKQPNELERIIRKMSELSKHLSRDELVRKRISLPSKFAAAYLTKQGGGYLGITLDNHNRVSLYIPPEALSQDDPQLVYMYIPPPATNTIGTQSKEARITPTVRLGPSGLEFSKPIFLTIPYKNDIDSTSMQILSYRKKKSQGNAWDPFPNQVVTVPQKDEVTILITHFCDFECTGISKCRWVKVSTEVERLDAENCRVFVDVCNMLNKHDDCNAMVIQDNGGNIHVNINEINKSWTITNKPCKEIEKSQLCPSQPQTDAASSDAVQVVGLRLTFTAKLRNASKDDPDFSATIDVFQHNNHRRKLILKAFDMAISEAAFSDTEAYNRIEEDITEQFTRDVIIDDSRYFQCQANYHGICRSLDTCKVAEQGWKGFGHEIGIMQNRAMDWMQWLLSQGSPEHKLNNSPSSLLLDYFMKDTEHLNMTEKLQILKKMFVKIGNYDAMRYVDLEIEDRMDNSKINGKRKESKVEANYVEQENRERMDDSKTKGERPDSMDSGYTSRSHSIKSVESAGEIDVLCEFNV